VKNSSLDSVAKAITSLNEIYKKDPKLTTIMEAPTLSAADKSQIIAELQKHTGGADKDNTVKNFLTTLADYNRLGLLKGVCEKFGQLMSASKGEVELTVTSASVRFPSSIPITWDGSANAGFVHVVAIGQQDPFSSRDRRLEIPIRRPRKEAQGYKQGTIISPIIEISPVWLYGLTLPPGQL
jgi:hypothetical protein